MKKHSRLYELSAAFFNKLGLFFRNESMESGYYEFKSNFENRLILVSTILWSHPLDSQPHAILSMDLLRNN